MNVRCCAEHAAKEGFYTRYVSPWLLHGACSMPPILAQRQQTVPRAKGVTVELGMGTGLNLPHYDAGRVTKLIGIDPGMALMEMAQAAMQAAPFDVDLHVESAEDMPLDDNIADSVVVTYSLCTIPNPRAALAETRRVLKPGGRIFFSEHGMSDQRRTATWQSRINPLWKRMAGGCNLNRNVEELLLSEGYEITDLEKKRMPGVPGVLGFNYRGSAVPR